ncbi:LysE family transporter [Lacticaseibacillus pabuli]|uniref:LysE family transporter n=1 Tax=Lacticaseibacillus pabuli TaxID=3025672 RepID=A0ABY7WSN8_9LACO|nr:LysE family transporter [Lacticaseibacillus sp. KACC 23028]WDF82804.1 LysE family transporter [Lacticaseibacillus sp. KACC 23028]
MLAVYLKGMLISIALVSSIGMQNLYVFNNALGNKTPRAMLYALFIWIADAVLTIAAFLGLGGLIAANDVIRLIVMFIGGIIVVWMGISTIRGASASTIGGGHADSTRQAITSAVIVTFANPQAIIDTGLMLGALRGSLTNGEVLPFLGGVLSSTALWFFGITLILGLLRSRLPRKLMLWVNIISGMIITGYGLVLLYQVTKAVL